MADPRRTLGSGYVASFTGDQVKKAMTYNPGMLMRVVEDGSVLIGKEDARAFVRVVLDANIKEPIMDVICDFVGVEGIVQQNLISGKTSTRSELEFAPPPHKVLLKALDWKLTDCTRKNQPSDGWADIFTTSKVDQNAPFSESYSNLVLLAMLLFDFRLQPGQVRKRLEWCKAPFSYRRQTEQ